MDELVLAYDKEALSAFDPPSEWRYLENDQDREGWLELKHKVLIEKNSHVFVSLFISFDSIGWLDICQSSI